MKESIKYEIKSLDVRNLIEEMILWLRDNLSPIKLFCLKIFRSRNIVSRTKIVQALHD